MRHFKSIVTVLGVCSSLALLAPARAHDGPEHEIEELTERIKHEGASADLLLQRATEYNVLGKSAEAIKDLEHAIQFDARDAGIQRELARAYFTSGKTNEALDAVVRGLRYAEDAPGRASLLMMRSEILRARREYQKALDDANRAIREHPDNAEWYLDRSQLQEQLKLKDERIKGLADGFKETGSGLLEAEWIDALIDGGKSEVALAKIEAELKTARWRSTWLIRRAKVRQAAGQTSEAKEDLKAAVAELNHRANVTSPDPLLLADRGMAHELLGNDEDALKDYEKAKELGINDEWLRDRIRALKEAGDKAKDKGSGKD